MISQITPAVNAAFEAQDRVDMRRQLVALTCELAVARANKGIYPASLDELAEQTGARIPLDIYSGKPLRYRRVRGGGFELYSVGMNGKDDGGHTFEDGFDDLVITSVRKKDR